MNKRGVAVLFFLTLLTALAALYQDTQFDARLAQEHSSALTAERELSAIDVALASVRAAQSMYVPGAPRPDTAFGRVTELLDTMESALQERQKTAAGPELAARYDAALQGLAEVRNVDVRARAALGHKDGGNASQMIADEGAQSAEKLTGEVAQARRMEQERTTASAGRISQMRTGVTALAMFLLVAVSAVMARALAGRGGASTAQMIKELPPPVRNGALSITNGHTSTSMAVTPAAGSATVTATATPLSGTPVPVPVAVPALAPPIAIAALKPATLTAAAELCVDLARLLDGRDVPALLARASAVLDAKGIMIWSADAASEELRPSLAHGYSEKVLRKLQPLAMADENITSQTFRTMKPQSMNGHHGGESMAIAVPLISTDGCVGVMAAEIRHSRSQADVMALARIIAAQFATIIGPADEGLSKAAEA
jgi:hypothetical protein